MCAFVHDGGPCITITTAALVKRELHQGVTLNVADVSGSDMAL